MADELESQKEAEKNNEQPDGVQLAPPVGGDQSGWQRHPGEFDIPLPGEKPADDAVINHASPQEHNIVGELDHSTFPPTVKTPLKGTYNHVFSGEGEMTTAKVAKPASITDKTSGDEKDAGDWTTKGDGTKYPEA